MKQVFTLLIGFAMHGWIFAQPITQHPENSNYFIYKGKPTVLVTSAEHYGAVINPDFDFELYLNTLEKIGLNHTRIFLGDYVENEGAFCIATNTLAPVGSRFLAPWARSSQKGYVLGGKKFDLEKWDDAYFSRLHQLMELAQEKGIVVEAVLFFSGYLFENSPLHPQNNINGTTAIPSNQYMTLTNGNILRYQEEYTKKLVEELNGYDNLIINVANEPWFGNQQHKGFASPPPPATKAWIQLVSEWITETEKNLENKHLISLDYTNQGEFIPEEELNGYFRNITVFNHHYDKDCESLMHNYNRGRIMSFNETGIMPPQSPQYRIQGWKYMLSGGALYNNLDFTFQVGQEDGSGSSTFCEWYQGSSNPDIKYELANLLKFMNELDFIHMKPDTNKVNFLFGHQQLFVFSGDQQTVVYFTGGGLPKLGLDLENGQYNVQWINPADLKILESNELTIDKGRERLSGPEFKEDMILKLVKTK